MKARVMLIQPSLNVSSVSSFTFLFLFVQSLAKIDNYSADGV